MNVLFLGSRTNQLINFLQERENKIIIMEEKLVLPRDQHLLNQIDFVVSFGYRHIVKPEVINQFPNRIINLHISLLPYNRGADPNLWSFLEDTPKGVTIHQLAEGLDTGDILCQKDLTKTFQDQLKQSTNQSQLTLSSSYQQLQDAIIQLFQENWDLLKTQQLTPIPQDHSQATSHLSKQKTPIIEQLSEGWNTPVSEVIQNFSKTRRPHQESNLN